MLGEPSCSFGHYNEEMVMWNYDRNDKFKIADFIALKRKESNQAGASVTIAARELSICLLHWFTVSEWYSGVDFYG